MIFEEDDNTKSVKSIITSVLPVYYHQERRSSHKLPGKVGKKTQAHGII
jgi:hypothetical protein